MSIETPVSTEEFDLTIPSGRLRVKRYGSADAPLVIGIPGLSANLVSFDFTGERLAGPELQLVALDLRGRGLSDVTPPGTYGWPSHARDVIAVADELGAERFSVIGHSMGAGIALVCAREAGSRIDKLVLVDAVGAPDVKSAGPIAAAVSRLGAVYPSFDQYLELVKGIGTVRPWSDYWERYFRYELKEVEGGVTARSNAAAVMEDAAFGAGALAFDDDAAIYQLWKYVTMPALLLRASQEILPGFGHIVQEADARRFAAEVPGAKVVEIDANHYGIATSEETIRALAEFF